MKTKIHWTDFRNPPKIPNFIKIRRVEVELSHADRRKDIHDESNGRFSQFCART